MSRLSSSPSSASGKAKVVRSAPRSCSRPCSRFVPSASLRLTPLPLDYDDVARVVQNAIADACKNSTAASSTNNAAPSVYEIEIPVGGLRNVPGDVEGNVEHNLCMGLIQRFVATFEASSNNCTGRRAPTDVRGKCCVLFPDKTELKVATSGLVAGFRQGAFDFDAPFPNGAFDGGRCTYLRDPSVFTEVPQVAKFLFGGGASGTKQEETIAARIRDDDAAFIVAYPSVNISDLTAALVELPDAIQESSSASRPVITVNAELDRIRSGYYPAIWTKFEMDELRERMKRVNAIAYLHNFKGSKPAALWRVFDEPWQLLRYNPDGSTTLIWMSEPNEPMTSLQRCALELIPKFWASPDRTRVPKD